MIRSRHLPDSIVAKLVSVFAFLHSLDPERTPRIIVLKAKHGTKDWRGIAETSFEAGLFQAVDVAVEECRECRLLAMTTRPDNSGRTGSLPPATDIPGLMSGIKPIPSGEPSGPVVAGVPIERGKVTRSGGSADVHEFLESALAVRHFLG